ncbi:gliding motility-associated C-terminal domain-containing protein [Flavisolibacter sp. BT320]|nr:gliding motility-associated C-terminal domain-containing protein [Flavisolibacter longurius]
MRGVLTLFLIFFSLALSAQTVCTNPGQTPATAFPVCGTSTFSQASVPLCGGRRMAYKNCGTDLLTDINPYWYKFTCFQSGTLGFTITPLDLNEDYDWELYDITGRNPDDVFTDASLVISNNWSGEAGITGASAAGSQLFVCGGYGKPLFSQRPQLIAGHNYLLLVSHFTNSQSGYNLAFGGGTAVIADSTTPHLQKVEANCGGNELQLKLNKKMKCSSIASNGSDFYLMPGNIPVTGSTGIGCSGQFDTDSLHLQLSASLQPGNYTLHIKKGDDNNTILDYCDRPIAETETLPFTIPPKAPTPMDSMAALSCAPTEICLLFKKPILCSSLTAGGTEFVLNGPYPVSVTAVNTGCNNSTTKELVLTLSQALANEGAFDLVLQRGTDGNTMLDECGEETPVGSRLSFSVKDTVNADFTYAIRYGCEKDMVDYFHPGANGVTSWQWKLDEAQQSGLQNPVGIYSVFNQKKIQLSVTNGFCTDSSEQTVVLDNFLKADFTVLEDICPNEPVVFTSMAEGRIATHLWEFGDGGTAGAQDPTHIYAGPQQQIIYPVRYTVVDDLGCRKTAVKNITVFSSCLLSMPTAFTPNGDGKNDVFRILNAVKAENLELLVFNRWGQQIFKTKDWKKGWDGRIKGEPQPTGVYVWLLRYTNRDTKQKVEQKGVVTLIR